MPLDRKDRVQEYSMRELEEAPGLPCDFLGLGIGSQLRGSRCGCKCQRDLNLNSQDLFYTTSYAEI